MAYVEPNSTVMLLRHIPLEPDYEHTVRLAAGAQAGAFGAYYEIPAGIYNIKSGFEYLEGIYSRHGILAPIYQDIVYKNASTNAANWDWYINGSVVVNQDSISVTYLPGGESFYSPMPELTAYAATGQDSIYQYGYAFDYETGRYRTKPLID